MTSSIPTVAALQPTTVELQAGETIHYCTCGRSATQPFCDGSHQGTEFQPQAFTPETTGKAQLCQCKQTANPPFCDGSHARVPSDRIGQEFQLASSEPGDPMPEAKPTPEEPTVALIHELAEHGLENVGPDGPVAAMGVPLTELPRWDDLQIVTAQLARLPLMDVMMSSATTPMFAVFTFSPPGSGPVPRPPATTKTLCAPRACRDSTIRVAPAITSHATSHLRFPYTAANKSVQ